MAELEWVDLDLHTNTKFVTHPRKVASRGKCEWGQGKRNENGK